MLPTDLLSRLQDVRAAIGHLLDHGVEVLSIHIGPATLTPTIHVMPCKYTRNLQSMSTFCPLTWEQRAKHGNVELAWIPGTSERLTPEALRQSIATFIGDSSHANPTHP